MTALRRTVPHCVTLALILGVTVWAAAGQALPGFASFGDRPASIILLLLTARERQAG